MARPRSVTMRISPLNDRLCVKNQARKGLHIQNTHAANSVFLGGPTVTAAGGNIGIELVAKAIISWNINDHDRTYEWFATSVAGGEVLVVTEVY